MSILYRGPSIDASYQVSYHLAKHSIEGSTSKMYNIAFTSIYSPIIIIAPRIQPI
jgi:hypothetical protein